MARPNQRNPRAERRRCLQFRDAKVGSGTHEQGATGRETPQV